MRQPAQETKHEHRFVGGRERAHHIGDGEDRHEADQQSASGDSGCEYGDHGGADHHAQCIGADDVAGCGLVDAEPDGEVGQQAHRGEFGGADGEAAHGQRQEQVAGVTRQIRSLQSNSADAEMDLHSIATWIA